MFKKLIIMIKEDLKGDDPVYKLCTILMIVATIMVLLFLVSIPFISCSISKSSDVKCCKCYNYCILKK